MMTDKEKRCYKCGETKPLEEFSNNKSRKGGKDARCKQCFNQYRKQHYKSNAEKERQYGRQWRKDNPERCKQNDAKWYKNNIEKRKQYLEENREHIKQRSAEYRKRMMSEGIACVYELFFKEDVKYIGETLCLKQRKSGHHSQLVAPYSHDNKKLQEEFDKHNLSKDDVTLEILVEFNKDDYESDELLRDALRKEEKKQIALYEQRGIALCN